MVRHAAAPAPRSKQGARHGAARPSLAGTVLGKTIILGVAPAMVLGGALAPAATALTLEPTLEPEGTSAPVAPQDSALPDAGTTAAEVERVAVAAAPAAEIEVVDDVTGADPEPGTDAGAEATAADGEVVLDTADTDGRLAGEIAVPAGFQTVGLSWPAEIDQVVPEMQMRTRAVDGSWSEWSHLEKSTDNPDEGSAVMTSAPVYVGEADAVQIATVDEAEVFPEGVELSMVSSAQVTTAAATTSGAVASTTTAGGPTVITREEWGAAPPRAISECPWGAAESLEGGVVHHTVNPNDYATVAEAMQAIRNDQAYHQQTHGWCDIGYNFLVDKWGNIYEGADGSLERPVIGAHTGGFNTGTVGVAMLGTYTNQAGVAPTAAQQDGVANIIGYRLSRYGVNPDESATFTARGHTDGGRYYTGDQVVLPRVFSHRDTHQTECPGELAYPLISGIQDRAATYARQYTEVAEKYKNAVQAIYQDMLGRPATSADIRNWAYPVSVSGTGVLADTMEKSDQYRRARIVSAFRATLGYTPSSTQVSGYVTLVKQGTLTVDDIEPYLMWKSKSYYDKVGGTKAAYVTALYKHILHRTPTAYQRDRWVSRLSTLGKQGVVQAMWDSKTGVALRVTATYQHYVNITPSTAQRDTWVQRLTSGTTEAALRRALIVSKTYLAYADSRY